MLAKYSTTKIHTQLHSDTRHHASDISSPGTLAQTSIPCLFSDLGVELLSSNPSV